MGQSGRGVDLDTSVAYLVKVATSKLHVSLDAALRPLGMTITQYACLELLSQRPGMSNSELARRAFVTRQSMNVVLHTLERDGLVKRPAHAPVGRALPTTLTARGRRRLAAASSAVLAVEETMLAAMNSAERNRMRRSLQACISSLDQAGM